MAFDFLIFVILMFLIKKQYSRLYNLLFNLINQRQVYIRCPLCDIEFQPLATRTNICTNCLLQQSSISDNIVAHQGIEHCRNCERYNRPPWILVERESKEILSMCLKRIKGVEDKIIKEAKLLFTDPSSKLFKLKLLVQQEIQNGTSIQEFKIIDIQEIFTQCEDCKREFTPHTWVAQIQLRQRVNHKKTFLHLEQLIIQHHLEKDILKIEAVDDGINFFYKQKQHALHMLEFMRSYMPIKVTKSKEVYSFIKYTYVVDVPAICKDDLIIVPKKLCQQLGGIGQIQLCRKVSSFIHLWDPNTQKNTELYAEKYFQYQTDFIIFSIKEIGVEFTILDQEKKSEELYRIELMKDDGLDYNQYSVLSHLNLKAGQTAQGFDLTNQNNELSEVSKRPDIIIVRRKFEKTNKPRQKLKKLAIEDATTKKKKNEDDIEDEFMDELEIIQQTIQQ